MKEMMNNLFDLYRQVQSVPFKARRSHWSKSRGTLYVNVEKVELNDHNDYGQAYGYVYENGKRVEWHGFKNGKVANPGVGGWERFEQ